MYNLHLFCFFFPMQVSFAYSFKPSDTLFARPFGLVLNIYYKDEVSTLVCGAYCQESKDNCLVTHCEYLRRVTFVFFFVLCTLYCTCS